MPGAGHVARFRYAWRDMRWDGSFLLLYVILFTVLSLDAKDVTGELRGDSERDRLGSCAIQYLARRSWGWKGKELWEPAERAVHRCFEREPRR
jgi:hypothetical protein